VVVAAVATAALPDASAARAGTSAMRATSSIDRLAAGASSPAPGACSSATSAALGEGARDSASRGEPAPHHTPLLPPPPSTSSLGSPGERAPAAPSAPSTRCSSPSCARPALAPVATRRGWLLGSEAWAGPTVRRPQSPSAEE
jgi:hypothetical protein